MATERRGMPKGRFCDTSFGITVTYDDLSEDLAGDFCFIHDVLKLERGIGPSSSEIVQEAVRRMARELADEAAFTLDGDAQYTDAPYNEH